jgi:hypothetical protein
LFNIYTDIVLNTPPAKVPEKLSVSIAGIKLAVAGGHYLPLLA